MRIYCVFQSASKSNISFLGHVLGMRRDGIESYRSSSAGGAGLVTEAPS